MPKYRQLHVKIIDSYDFNEMPDDFCRVTWMLLSIVVDSEGRGIDNPVWIRSKMYPMREDITPGQIQFAFDWFERRGMILRYKVVSKYYFYIPTFKVYQTGTDKEAKSVLPSPPDLLDSYSVVSREFVKPSCIVYESESVNESESDKDLFKNNSLNNAFVEASAITPHTLDKWVKALETLEKLKADEEIICQAVGELRERNYTIIGPWSILNSVRNIVGKQNGIGKHTPKLAGTYVGN